MRQVISASRRTDVPMHFAGWLADAVREGALDVPQPYTGTLRRVSLKPEDVHTLVLWSKDFRPVLEDEGGVRQALKRYDQVFCHLTVTGLGGTPLEPCIAHWQEVIGQLPELVAFAGDPQRVSVRYDPILHWYDGPAVRSNLSLFEPILQSVHRAGVPTIRLSFATLYGKVRKRRGHRWYDPTLQERLEITGKLVRFASSVGIEIHACSQGELHAVGAMPSRCVNGELLSALHPRGLPADTRVDPGQRRDCGCTVSVDIGSYNMRCPNGCRYCYANPRIPVGA